MAQQHSFTGKWEDILKHSDELAGREVQITVLEGGDIPESAVAGPRNLAELLGEYIGAVEGKGKFSSAEVSNVFSEGMVRKHRVGQL